MVKLIKLDNKVINTKYIESIDIYYNRYIINMNSKQQIEIYKPSLDYTCIENWIRENTYNTSS
jgi:hypothetical protein